MQIYAASCALILWQVTNTNATENNNSVTNTSTEITNKKLINSDTTLVKSDTTKVTWIDDKSKDTLNITDTYKIINNYSWIKSDTTSKIDTLITQKDSTINYDSLVFDFDWFYNEWFKVITPDTEKLNDDIGTINPFYIWMYNNQTSHPWVWEEYYNTTDYEWSIQTDRTNASMFLTYAKNKSRPKEKIIANINWSIDIVNKPTIERMDVLLPKMTWITYSGLTYQDEYDVYKKARDDNISYFTALKNIYNNSYITKTLTKQIQVSDTTFDTTQTINSTDTTWTEDSEYITNNNVIVESWVVSILSNNNKITEFKASSINNWLQLEIPKAWTYDINIYNLQWRNIFSSQKSLNSWISNIQLNDIASWIYAMKITWNWVNYTNKINIQ